MASSILVVSSDRNWAQALAEAMCPYLLRVHEAYSAESARGILGSHVLELVVLDVSVLSLQQFVASRNRRRCPAVVVGTQRDDYQTAVLAVRERAVDLVRLPIAVVKMVEIISRALDGTVASPHYLARRIDRYLEANCGETSLSLSGVSAEFGISSSYTSLLLRNRPWRGFRDRLARHRVARAKARLLASDEPLYLISEVCGFSSPSRFSETFSRIVGVTPKRFRESRADGNLMGRIRRKRRDGIEGRGE